MTYPFSRSDAPAKHSPMGKLMARIAAESAGIDFEACRDLARTQLLKVAGRKRYSVTTPRQDRQRASKLTPRVNAVLEMAFTGHSTRDSGQ